jgi:hypothetical protein
MKQILLIISAFVLLGVATVRAETLVRGKLTDAATGAPLETATVHVRGTYDATISNPEGLFELSISALPATVRFSHIGYRTHDLVISEPPAHALDVGLDPVVFQLDEMVVTPDMGDEIMRKVIAHKQVWRKRLESFQVDAYSRFAFKNHTGIVSIIESASQGFWDHEQGWREVIKARRQTSNMELDFDDAIPAASSVTNLYDDDVEVAGHHLIGVTHPDALDHYDFEVTGQRFLDEETVYDIAVKPRHKLTSGFEGQVSVIDSVYALVAVTLRPGQSFMFPPPIKKFSVGYHQQFRDFGEGIWLPVDFRFEAELDVGFIGLQFPLIRVEQVSRLSNYRVNTVVPDRLYSQKETVIVDSVAVQSDTLLTRPGLAVPLSEIEQEAYARIDSSMTLEKAYRPTGFLSRFIDSDDDKKEERRREQREDKGAKKAEGGAEKKRRNLSLDVKPDLWFNRVDGGHLGLSVGLGKRRGRIRLGSLGAYNTSLKRWAFAGDLTGRWGEHRRGFTTVSAFRGTDVRYRSNLYNRLTVSSQQPFGAEDYFDYFWNERVRARAGYRFRRLDISLSGGVNIEQHASVAKTTDWHLFGDVDVQRPNPMVDDGYLRSGTLRMEWKGEEDGPAPLFGQRRVVLEVEHTRTGWGSDFEFTQFRGVVDWRFETFLKRRFLPNVLDVRLVGSTFTGTLPLQRYGILDAWLDGFSTFGAFRSRLDRPYEGERLLAIFWEHNFRTVPFELVGWRWMAERGIGVILHGAHGRTWISDGALASLAHIPQYQDEVHHELGLSVNGLFKLFRVNFTRRLDAPESTISLGLARIF